MTDTSAAATEGECVYCAASTTRAAAATRPFVRGEPNPDGTIPLVPRPRVWLCADCMGRHARREVLLGWCGKCFAWGAAYEDSPCGWPYEPEMLL